MTAATAAGVGGRPAAGAGAAVTPALAAAAAGTRPATSREVLVLGGGCSGAAPALSRRWRDRKVRRVRCVERWVPERPGESPRARHGRRPGRRGRHNIWEIVLHTAYWKYIVRRRLTHNPELAFPRAGSNWPALPAKPDAAAWRRDVALLKDQHRLLRAVVARFPAARLNARGWRSTWTNAQHVYGIASHDLYHAGQIQLVKALRRR